jgi:tripartite-type tricarboxylate transporter receptor subunit TctC
LLPDVPTVAESGLKGFEANNWYGIVVPAKTSRAIIMQLHKAATTALETPAIKEILFRQGLDAAPESPEAFGAYIKAEGVKWEKVIKAANLYHSN